MRSALAIGAIESNRPHTIAVADDNNTPRRSTDATVSPPRLSGVNAISAGPLKTLAAYGIKGMRSMLNENAEKTPLRRNIEQDDVARAALYLCSDLARNVTGEVLYVDAGQNILGIVSME